MAISPEEQVAFRKRAAAEELVKQFVRLFPSNMMVSVIARDPLDLNNYYVAGTETSISALIDFLEVKKTEITKR